MHLDRYGSYSELAGHEVKEIDFAITVSQRPFSAVAVIAPHGRRKRTGGVSVGHMPLSQF